jgi:NDP-sugar pyrophosphorylase family protein
MIYKKTWKYILIKDDTNLCNNRPYYRLEALKNFGDVKRGDRGGYIQYYRNLSQSGNCWVYDYAIVFGNARVTDNAKISGCAQVFENAMIFGNAKVLDFSYVQRNSKIFGNAIIYGTARISSDVGGRKKINYDI